MDDEKIVAGCIKGNQRYWELLYSKYAPKIKAYVTQFYFNKNEIEDACQDIFIELFRSLKNFRGDSSLSAYILKISKFKCISTLRKNKAAKRSSEKIALDVAKEAGIEPSVPSFEEEFTKRKDSELIISLIPNLSTSCKEIIKQRYFFDRSYNEIANTMELPLGTLCSKLRRCIIKLKKYYDEEMKDYA